MGVVVSDFLVLRQSIIDQLTKYQGFYQGILSILPRSLFFRSLGQQSYRAVKDYMDQHQDEMPPFFESAITRYIKNLEGGIEKSLEDGIEKNSSEVHRVLSQYPKDKLQNLQAVLLQLEQVDSAQTLENLYAFSAALAQWELVDEYLDQPALRDGFLKITRDLLTDTVKDKAVCRRLSELEKGGLLACVSYMTRLLGGLKDFKLMTQSQVTDVQNAGFLSKFHLVGQFDLSKDYTEDKFFEKDEARNPVQVTFHGEAGERVVVSSQAITFKHDFFDGARLLLDNQLNLNAEERMRSCQLLDRMKVRFRNSVSAGNEQSYASLWRQLFYVFLPQNRLEKQGLYTQHAFSYLVAGLFLSELRITHSHKLAFHLYESDPSRLQIEAVQIVGSVRHHLSDVGEVVALTREQLGGDIAEFRAVYDIRLVECALTYQVAVKLDDYTEAQVFQQYLAKRGLLHENPAALAAVNGDVDQLVSLIESGEDINEVSNPGTLMLIEPPSRELYQQPDGKYDDEQYQRALSAYNDSISASQEGLSPLHLAVLGNHLDAVKACIVLGAHMHDSNDGVFHQTAYDLAVMMYGGSSKMAKYLLLERKKQVASLRVLPKEYYDFDGIGVAYSADHRHLQGRLETMQTSARDDADFIQKFESSSAVFRYFGEEWPVLDQQLKKIDDSIVAWFRQLERQFGVKVEAHSVEYGLLILPQNSYDLSVTVDVQQFSLSKSCASLMPGVNYLPESGASLFKFHYVIEMQLVNEALKVLKVSERIFDLTKIRFFESLMPYMKNLTATHAVDKVKSVSNPFAVFGPPVSRESSSESQSRIAVMTPTSG